MYIAMYDCRVGRMIRKQIYIEVRQERQLKRRAKELGLTEAALIRQGIDRLDTGVPMPSSRERALREHDAVIRKRIRMRVPQTGRRWTREELYDERLSRQVR